jgi:uncharacterized protein
MNILTKLISKELHLSEKYVDNTLTLLESGATIPFISRYRKEATGGMNELQVADVLKHKTKYTEFLHRRDFVINAIEEQGKLTDELKQRIDNCWNLTELEDIYLPFKPKRKTKAEEARRKGLGALANNILLNPFQNPEVLAEKYLNEEVSSIKEALEGAKDIIAEQINENEKVRNKLRKHFKTSAIITSKVVKGKEEEASKFQDYFNYTTHYKRCSGHRLLAIQRGVNEGFLKMNIQPENEDDCVLSLLSEYPQKGKAEPFIKMAMQDAYKRLLKPSISTEFISILKKQADEEAIRVFAQNLEQLLLTPPLGQKRIMGIDPGFRTGCKVVCLDEQGSLIFNDTIYPHPPKSQWAHASCQLKDWIEIYKIQAIAIGNGTAGRETEELVKALHNPDIHVFMVNEDGASVYSASAIARDEFPNHDVTVRGAVSIGRRLSDPLAELVKIDPKSIGVGQYQHDVDQGLLKNALDQTIEKCVNLVGVNVNTASKFLLTYVSGLGPTLANNIIQYRLENGSFNSRHDLMKVPRLGAKIFEQCAGFLRIPNAKNPLDNTAVHPESYTIVKHMADDLGCALSELIASKEKQAQIQLERYITPTIGLPTLNDILEELQKPGRDPRGEKKIIVYNENITSIEDLNEGMIMTGVVSNITNFGCFIDLGIKQKGLLHISEISNKYISSPSEVLNLQQQVTVKVINIDLSRGRISLTMKGVAQN